MTRSEADLSEPLDQGAVPPGIVAGHAEIRRMLALLDAGADIEQIRDLLRRLSTGLGAHFELEEGPDGLFPALVEERPQWADQIRELTVEHLEVMCLLGDLGRAVGDPEADRADVQRAADAFERCIRRHEAKEVALLNRIVEVDGRPL
jgi:hypothetical protein